MSATAVQVRERPLICSGESVRAILAGRKTQTRRVVTGENSEFGAWGSQLWQIADLSRAWVDGKGSGSEYLHVPVDDAKCVGEFAGMQGIVDRLRCRMAPERCWDQEADPETAYVPPAARLWVRERFSYREHNPDIIDDLDPMVWYWADGAINGPWNFTKPKPSIHMPRWASRITLELTDVRVERVQEITNENCEAEGLWHASPEYRSECCVWRDSAEVLSQLPRRFFGKWWDSLNAKRGFGWDANPWVWVLTFAVSRPPEGGKP